MTAAFTAMTIAQDQTAPAINLDSLIRVASRLVDVLKRETELLKNHHLKEAAKLAAEKNQLSTDYAKLQSAATQNPEAFKNADPDKKSAFQQVIEELRQVLAMNERALRIAITAGERIVRHVKEAVQSKRATMGGYTAGGQYHSKTADAPATPALYNKAV